MAKLTLVRNSVLFMFFEVSKIAGTCGQFEKIVLYM